MRTTHLCLTFTVAEVEGRQRVCEVEKGSWGRRRLRVVMRDVVDKGRGRLVEGRKPLLVVVMVGEGSSAGWFLRATVFGVSWV